MKPTPEEAYTVIRTEKNQRQVIGLQVQSGGEGPSSVVALGIGLELAAKPPGGPPVAVDDLVSEVRQGYATRPHLESGRGPTTALSSRGTNDGGGRS